MQKEIRTICYDEDLHLEAYRFEGIVQPFPNHFHDYYVIGFIESGTRRLSCRNIEYTADQGSILLFNPGDNHACTQCDGGTLDYRGLNIPRETMLSLTQELTGSDSPIGFSKNVIINEEMNRCLHKLHQMIMEDSHEFEKEELLLLLIVQLTKHCGQPFASGLSKSTLLRAFVRCKGVTPYKYLQAVRIDNAKKLLEQGESPIHAALRTGFADQSHFSRFFHMFIGLSPSVYRQIFQKGGATHES